jgi:hypothetical protein
VKREAALSGEWSVIPVLCRFCMQAQKITCFRLAQFPCIHLILAASKNTQDPG